MQMPHDVFGKLLQVAMNEAEQSQTHRQHENSLCSSQTPPRATLVELAWAWRQTAAASADVPETATATAMTIEIAVFMLDPS